MQCIVLEWILDQENTTTTTTIKRTLLGQWKNLNMGCKLDNKIVSMLNFQILIVVLWFCTRMPLNLGNKP